MFNLTRTNKDTKTGTETNSLNESTKNLEAKAASTVDENEDQVVFSPYHDTDKIPADVPTNKPEVDDRFETSSQFEARIANAIAMGETRIETTPEIIKLYCPRGLGEHPWFMYRNIMVCERGMSERIDYILNEQMGQKTFGMSEAKVDHRA